MTTKDDNESLNVVRIMTLFQYSKTWWKILLVILYLTLSNPVAVRAADSSGYAVAGVVVYETSEGIERIRIGDDKAIVLIAGGKYPRWSPDGKYIVFVRGNDILIMTDNGEQVRLLATAQRAKAVCFFSDGKSVLFTDGQYIRRVNLDTGQIETILSGRKFMELDIAGDGKRLVTTVKSFPGLYYVLAVYIPTGTVRTVSRGCSASISPDGRFVTVNGPKHKSLNLFSWERLDSVGKISAPGNFRFDNQFWSNRQDWLVSKTEGSVEDIFIHRLSDDKSFQVTFSGQCDRPDFYIESPDG